MVAPLTLTLNIEIPGIVVALLTLTLELTRRDP